MAFKDPERQREYARAYRERNRDRIRAKQRARYAAKKELIYAQSREWKAQNPERAALLLRRSALRLKYGIELEDYDRMLAAQNGGCAVCHAPPNGKYLHVDHDHRTGMVRGLLCQRCNMALGLLEHDSERLFSASRYLLAHSDVLEELTR